MSSKLAAVFVVILCFVPRGTSLPVMRARSSAHKRVRFSSSMRSLLFGKPPALRSRCLHPKSSAGLAARASHRACQKHSPSLGTGMVVEFGGTTGGGASKSSMLARAANRTIPSAFQGGISSTQVANVEVGPDPISTFLHYTRASDARKLLGAGAGCCHTARAV